ncbi:MAG: phosphatase PAP2 family protein [Candidatus Hodarchaeota archaeon]
MSENEILSKKLFLFVLISIAAIFVIGLIFLLSGYNDFFCEYFYTNDITYLIFSAISFVGDTTFIILLIVTVWYVYDVKFAKNLALSILGSFYINSLLKDIIQDPRPWTNIKTGYTDPGFPSGHAQQSVAGYAYLGYEAYRKGKRYISWLFIILAYLIAISRVIIGVHDVQDIWGGLLIGIVWLIFFILLEPKVSEVIGKFNLITKILLSTVIPIVLFIVAILIFPTSDSDYGLITGGMMGLSLGYVINKEYINYDPRKISTKQKVLNFIIGIVITLLLYLGLRYIPLDILGQIWDFIRYFILAIILSTIVPWLFTKIQR